MHLLDRTRLRLIGKESSTFISLLYATAFNHLLRWVEVLAQKSVCLYERMLLFRTETQIYWKSSGNRSKEEDCLKTLLQISMLSTI